MMLLKFNNYGFIEPPDKYLVPFDLVENEFVKNFSASSSRHEIYRKFVAYIDNFKKEVSEEFEIFIDGSFVTKKENPSDIDFVIFVANDIFDSKQELIAPKYDREGALNYWGKEIQAFIVRKDKEENAGFFAFKAAYAYWWEHFEKTKTRVRGVKEKKGFLEVAFVNSNSEEK